MKKAIGEGNRIKRLTPKIFYETKGVDPTLNDTEITVELAKELKWEQDNIKIKSKKENFTGNNNVIVEITDWDATNTNNEYKLKLGFTICNMRRTGNINRCFKCHDFGHVSYNCTNNKNGHEVCRRCGHSGHNIKDCNGPNRCILCIRKGIPEEKSGHVAGALSCPQYKTYMGRISGRQL